MERYSRQDILKAAVRLGVATPALATLLYQSLIAPESASASSTGDAIVSRALWYGSQPNAYSLLGWLRTGTFYNNCYWFDCSGFVYRVYEDVGQGSLIGNSSSILTQKSSGQQIPIASRSAAPPSTLVPGALIFFTAGTSLEHVAIVLSVGPTIGSTRFISPQEPGKSIGIFSVDEWCNYCGQTPVSLSIFPSLADQPAPPPYSAFLLHAATGLAPSDPTTWVFALADWDGDGISDLICVKRANTGSGNTEVHILSGASNFTAWILHTSIPLPETDNSCIFLVADWDRDGRPDLIFVHEAGTGSGNTEVHILSGAVNFQSWILHAATPLGPTADGTWTYRMADWDRDGCPDLVAIHQSGTQSGTTEVHILSGASNFQSWVLHAVTPLGPTDSTWAFDMADWNRDGIPDLVAIKMSNTGSGMTEVHILGG